ncbi:bifunctional 4-hydroxy-2-oxoglutarate aldolase/2-dehydro-3-deoxy-phosphogluconate aldolase [Microbacterium sp. NPDC090007]|uniref:bifunctional 4-hydroxy-2-oxoglutarate aldolase/2-dehydro-3-deoxy-phosphogluconate aldolase n=1 Tax=Microbacterium sp. NPDC090007 TaxID=3364204 RepID=UPI00382C8536
MSSPFADVAIVPVLTAPTASAAVIAGRALQRAGITCVEVTLRTAAGVDAIAALSEHTNLFVGAGTVLRPAEVDAVAEAGARFVVSPGLDERVVEATRRHGLHPLPGVATASEVQRAVGLGLSTVKFFPADRLGGLETIKALSAPFREVQFVPSGGISHHNLTAYLAHGAVAAVSGSWVAPSGAVAAEDGQAIETAATTAVETLVAAGFRVPLHPEN